MSTDWLVAAKHRCQSGITLIETIMFIVIVSVGVAGLMSVMSSMVKYSADPMIRRQALAVAESLLEEIMQQPFTNCDPDAFDASTSVCTQAEGLGPETIGGNTETRYSVTNPFDNVNDYHNFKMEAGIQSITGDDVLQNFTAEVTIAQVGDKFSIPIADVLKITVKVTEPNVKITDPDSEKIILTGYRFLYAPTP